VFRHIEIKIHKPKGNIEKEMNKMAKGLKMVLGALLVVGVISSSTFAFAETEAAWTKPISIGSGSIGSSHYSIMTGMAALLTKYTGLTVTAEATRWSAGNVDLLREHEIELSSVTADAVYDAWNGENYFQGKPQKFLRLVHSGYTSVSSVVAREDSGIKSLSDLKGKRFYAWHPTSPMYQRWCKVILEANGLNRDNLTLMQVVSTKEAVAALIQNRADAALIVGSIPTAAVIEVTNTIPCRIIPFTEKEVKVMDEKYPFVFPIALPANTYKGQDKEIITEGAKTHIMTTSELPDELIYRLTKAMMEHPDAVKAIHPAAKSITIENVFVRTQAPFHPGAVKYYKEAGVWNAEMQKRQEEFLTGKK